MINPLRSEADAFRFTLIVGALLAPVALVAIIWSAGAALARRRRPGDRAASSACSSSRTTSRARRCCSAPAPDRRRRPLPDPGRRQRDSFGPRPARRDLTARSQRRGAAEGRVPRAQQQDQALDQRGRRAPARQPAQRLQALLPALRSEGFDADGDIGDDDPVQAMEDGLRRFPRGRGDHLDAPARALELAGARRRRARPGALVDIKVTHVVVDLDREGVGPAPAT